MTQWLFFGIFLIVGLGVLGSAVYYLQKEKHDTDSVQIYRTMALIGIAVTVAAVLYRILA